MSGFELVQSFAGGVPVDIDPEETLALDARLEVAHPQPMLEASPPPGAVLLLIDLQKAIDHPSWGKRNNPDAEVHIRRLLDHWRHRGWPVWHIRHDSTEAASHYRPGQPGNEFKPEVAPLAGEVVISKRTNSAFIGTDLEARLRSHGNEALVILGVITTTPLRRRCAWPAILALKLM